MTNETNTAANKATTILAGAIERLDKANNPHMKRLQADLVHDLAALQSMITGFEKFGVELPFLPRLQGDNSAEAIEARQVADLVAR
jgi:hypothetical protein